MALVCGDFSQCWRQSPDCFRKSCQRSSDETESNRPISGHFIRRKGSRPQSWTQKVSLSGSSSEADREKAEKYSEEQNEIQKEAQERETEAKSNFHRHEVFARGVTLFQIAIAIAAISALTKRRRYWMVSMFIGAVGCIFLALGLFNIKPCASWPSMLPCATARVAIVDGENGKSRALFFGTIHNASSLKSRLVSSRFAISWRN